MGSRLGVLRWLATAVVILIPAGWFAYREFDDLTNQITGYSFEDTLPKMIDREGEDARVVSVLARDKNVFFAVLDGDKVRERFYGQVCESSANGPGSSCAYRETDDEHDASAGEEKLAQATLGELDPGVVDRVREAAGVGKEVPIGLRGRHWVVGSFEEGVAALANLDGSNLHPARRKSELALSRDVAEDPGR